jgi:DNA-binding transcriptional ArsR family regulator
MNTEALNESADRVADFLRAVAHPGRLRILCALIDGERSASQLAHQAQLSAPALSQQAAILEAKGLITRRRKARSILYRLVAPEAKPLAELLYRLFCKPPRAQVARRSLKRGLA